MVLKIQKTEKPYHQRLYTSTPSNGQTGQVELVLARRKHNKYGRGCFSSSRPGRGGGGKKHPLIYNFTSRRQGDSTAAGAVAAAVSPTAAVVVHGALGGSQFDPLTDRHPTQKRAC